MPMTPITSPCIMKMAITRTRDVPIVLRIAMSRLFCLTSRMSDEMMLSAPTITIRPIVIEMAIFSSHSAENSDRFSSDQSSLTYSGPSFPGIDLAIACRGPDVVDAQLDEVGRLLREQPLGEVEPDEAVAGVVLVQAELEDADDPHRRLRGMSPIGDSDPPG